METLLINDRSLSQSKQTKNSMEKPHYHPQYQTQHHVTRQPPNIRRQASCGAIHQKYTPFSNVQLEMVQAAIATGGGVFLNHYPPRQLSLNSSLPPILPTHLQPHYYQQQNKMNHHQQHQQQQQQPQQQQQQHPPLLPLPSKPAFRSLPPSPFPRKKPNKTKITTTTTPTTTSRKPAQNIKKENKVVVMVDETDKEYTKSEEDDQVVVVVGPAKEKEPDPVSPPKGSMTRVLREADLNNNINRTSSEITEVPSLFFNFKSPPPSSLPLPKFTMRQNKLSCNAEAAATDGVDSGATDNLRRMLKLR